MSDIKLKRTLGEARIRTDFNPSQQDDVNTVKTYGANLINLLQRQKTVAIDGEHARLLSIAQTEIEGAAMWAVKALTYKPE